MERPEKTQERYQECQVPLARMPITFSFACNRPGQQFFGLLILAAIFFLPGCATYSSGFAKVEREASNRNVAVALKSLDDLKLGGVDQTLYYLNKGMLLRFEGDYAASTRQFESAKNLMQKLAAISVAEQAGSVVVNDTLKAYEGTDVEQLLIYAFEELNYLQAGNADEAAVEARQFDIKQRLVAGNNSGANYLSGAFVRYLNGMTYEEVGEKDSARIDYRKAVEGYTAQSSISGFGVPASLEASLERIETPHSAQTMKKSARALLPLPAGQPGSPGMRSRETPSRDASSNGEVIFILHNGLGPSLAENVVMVANPDPQNGAAILSVAVPSLVRRPVPVAYFDLSEDSISATSEIVEDINAIAQKSLDDRLPAITARAVARMVLKNAAARKVKKQSEDAGTAGLLMSIASDVGAITSERADTRSWSLLPGNILLARLLLPAGMHNLKITFHGGHGNILATRVYNAVNVTAGRKLFMSDYYLQMPVNQAR